jgi:hypothetical protein
MVVVCLLPDKFFESKSLFSSYYLRPQSKPYIYTTSHNQSVMTVMTVGITVKQLELESYNNII